MIEIPESLTIASQLNDTVKGKRILEAEAAHTPHGFAWYEGDPREYHEKMAGKVVGTSRGIGSMIDMELEDYHFTVGDGTNMRYYEPEVKLPDRYQTKIIFEDGSSLVCTVQMYGLMALFHPEVYENIYYWAGVEKPMPGTEGFDYEYFCTLRDTLSGSDTMKMFLATNQRIPGLGNGVLQDILLETGLNPKRKIAGLQEADWKRIYHAVVDVLGQMIAAGGRDTEKDLFGNPGGYRTKLSKKTMGGPCPYCGTTIQKAAYLGGTVYFCPECQGGLKA